MREDGSMGIDDNEDDDGGVPPVAVVVVGGGVGGMWMLFGGLHGSVAVAIDAGVVCLSWLFSQGT